MQRKYLEDLGLEKEVIDKIMAEHGKTTTDYEVKLTAKDVEIKAGKDTVATLSAQVKAFDGVDLEALKKDAKDWETKYNTDISNLKIDAAIKLAIANDAQDADLVSGLIDKTKLKLENDKVTGLDELLKPIKESKPFLFKETKKAENETNPAGFEPYGGAPATTGQNFDFDFTAVRPKGQK